MKVVGSEGYESWQLGSIGGFMGMQIFADGICYESLLLNYWVLITCVVYCRIGGIEY